MTEALYEDLYHRYYDQVFAYVIRRASVDVAPDVLAETFLVAWRRRNDVPEEPLPWLYGVARNVLANHRRSGRREQLLGFKLAPEARTPASHHQGTDDTVLRAFGQLSERDQEALALIAWEELRPHEAALAAGCSARAFRARLHRARKRFRKALRAESQTRPEEAHVRKAAPRKVDYEVS